LPPTGLETGIDLGIEAFATRSDGTRIFSPGWYRKAERSFKTAQRRVARRMKGSNRRRKAVQLLAKGISVRWHSCPDCGTSLHRDQNAAKDIERLGQSLQGEVAQAAPQN
jgi:transposase